MSEQQNYFSSLYELPFKDGVRRKGNLDYLPWSTAWKLLKEAHPQATFEVHLSADQTPFFKHEFGGGFVMVSVTVDGCAHQCVHPVLDGRNKPVLKPSVFDVNRAQHRALAKACAYHGIALTLWTGEDLPEEVAEFNKEAFEQRLPKGWDYDKVVALCTERGWPAPYNVDEVRQQKLIKLLASM